MSVTGSSQGWSSSGTGGISVLPGVSAQRLRVAARSLSRVSSLLRPSSFQGRLAGAIVGEVIEPADLVEKGGVVDLAEIAAGFGQELLEGVRSAALENVVRIAADRRRRHPQRQTLPEIAHDAAVIGLRGRRLGVRVVAVMRDHDRLDRARQTTTPVGADSADGDDAVMRPRGRPRARSRSLPRRPSPALRRSRGAAARGRWCASQAVPGASGGPVHAAISRRSA